MLSPIKSGWPRGSRWKLGAFIVTFSLIFASIVWWRLNSSLEFAVRCVGGRYGANRSHPFFVFFERRGSSDPLYEQHLIDLRRSEVTDSWLAEHGEQIAQLPQVYLYLADTQITDQGLAALRGAPSIVSLDLTGTGLTDAAAAHIATLHELAEVKIGRTGISDAALDELSQIPALTVIGIDATQATPRGVQSLETYPFLFWVEVLDATDDSVEHLAALEGLTYLSLRSERLTPRCLPVLERMHELSSLTLYDAPFSEDELTELQSALPASVYQRKLKDIEREFDSSFE